MSAGRTFQTFKAAGVDIVTALILSSTDEAIGIAKVSAWFGLPSVIAFTIEKDLKRLASCNLQLQLQGEEPFCLTHVIVVFARSTYTSPALGG